MGQSCMLVSTTRRRPQIIHTRVAFCITLGTWHRVLYGMGRTLLSGRVVSRHITTTVCVYNLWKSELHFSFPLHPFSRQLISWAGTERTAFALCCGSSSSVGSQATRAAPATEELRCVRSDATRTHAKNVSLEAHDDAGRHHGGRPADGSLPERRDGVPRAREVFTSPTQPHRSSAPPCCRTCGGRSRYAGANTVSRNNVL